MSRLALVIQLKSALSTNHAGLYGWYNTLCSKFITGNHIQAVHKQHPEKRL